MKKVFLVGLVAALFAAFPLGAIAEGVDLPMTWTYNSEIDASQFGYTTVTISEDGTVAANILNYKNKKTDGDHFVTRGIVYSTEDVPLLGFGYGAGLNASFFGGAVEETTGWIGEIEPGLVSEIGWVGIVHATRDTVNDEELWKKIGEIAAEIFKAYIASEADSAAMVSGTPVAFIGLDGNGARLGKSPLGVILPVATPSP